MSRMDGGSFPDPRPDLSEDMFKVSIDDTRGFRDWWKVQFEDRFGLNRRNVASTLLQGLPDDVHLDYYKYGETEEGGCVEISLTGTSFEEVVYLYGQTIHVATNSPDYIEIDIMDVVPSRQRQGISATLMGNLRELAESLEITTLTVDAYLDAGPYAWLAYGFIPVQDAWSDIKERIAGKMAQLGVDLPQEVHDRVDRILASETPLALRALLGERMDVESPGPDGKLRTVPLVIALMADTGQRWYGVLDLDDDESALLLDATIDRNRR